MHSQGIAFQRNKPPPSLLMRGALLSSSNIGCETSIREPSSRSRYTGIWFADTRGSVSALPIYIWPFALPLNELTSVSNRGGITLSEAMLGNRSPLSFAQAGEVSAPPKKGDQTFDYASAIHELLQVKHAKIQNSIFSYLN